MKLHALALVAAFAMPAIASADDTKPANPPTATDTTKPMNPPAGTDTVKPGKLADADVKIIAHLHHVNQMEIELAKIAQKAGTAQVKNYASSLLTDHQSADKDLTAFARSHKLAAIPADKAMTEADRQDEKDMTTSMAHLKTLKGAEFDKEYLNMMVSGHDKELTRIDTAISAAGDADLQTMLKSVKPVLQRHADQARDLMKSPQAALEPPRDPSKPIDKLPSQR